MSKQHKASRESKHIDAYAEKDFDDAFEFWDYLAPENWLEPDKQPLFRGHGDQGWPLLPSIFRNGSAVLTAAPDGPDARCLSLEIHLIAQFVVNCDALGLRIPNDSPRLRQLLNPIVYLRGDEAWPPDELVGLLALAQHHKIPTRLLDWTTRGHVAAYFAASWVVTHLWSLKETHRMAVWTFLPHDLRFLQDRVVHVLSAPGATTVNLAAQASVFTLLCPNKFKHPSYVSPGAEALLPANDPPFLTKLTLPMTEAKALLAQCYRYQISAASLFPGYDGAASSVIESLPNNPRFSNLL